MKPKHIYTLDRFSTSADSLRNHFVDQFKDPRSTHAQRFVWDYWNIPNQYRLLRTPAQSYFPEKLYETFMKELIVWGQKNLGCQGISPPWLSYYVEGSYQNFHSDTPHGPWAFVYSLSPKKKGAYQGGQTMILKKSSLNFEHSQQKKTTYEHEDIFHMIDSPFNRLTVFDPRFPHGVSRVSGTEDPLNARLVIHGWFTHPYPLTHTKVGAGFSKNTIPEIFASIEQLTEFVGPVDGILVYELHIEPSGKVKSATLIQNTLIGQDLNAATLKSFLKELELLIKTHLFGKNPKSVKMTLPIPFQTS